MLDFIFEKYPAVRKYLLPIILGGAGAMCILAGIIYALITASPTPDSAVFTASEKSSAEAVSFQPVSPKPKQIIVDIEGSVVKAGIYRLSMDARLQNGLVAAGGLSQRADRSYIQKHINLAQKLSDGQKIYIPGTGESIQGGGQAAMTAGLADNQTGTKININESSSDQLDSLPGIGQVTVQKIIQGRPYNDINELLSRKIVSLKVFNGIKDKISSD